MVVSDRPVQEVLERAGKCACVVRSGEYDGSGVVDLGAKVGHDRIQCLTVKVGIEVWQITQTLIEHIGEAEGSQISKSTKHGRVGRAPPEASADQ
jgi:hypothetical protein